MSEWITPKVTIPQRNLSRELDQIYGSTAKYADPYYELEQKYGPLYNRLQLRNTAEGAMGYDENGVHVPGTLELGRTAAEFNRAQDIGDMERFAPRATAATLDANPFLRRSLGLLADQQEQSPILRMLNDQAQTDLNSGGFVSPEIERMNRETTRAAWADKGLGNTDQSAIDELMNREALRAGRVAASRKFAGDVEGLNNTFRDFLGRTTQIDATALPDAWTAILGRGGSGGTGGGLTPIGQYTKAFDPYNAYFQDLFSSNQNAAATQAIGNAQNQAATRAAIASIAGSAIHSDIRAKENIREIGEARLANGKTVPRYSFTYRAGCVPRGLRGDRAYEGVMADDVEAVFPGAVSVDRETGFKQVDYAMIDVEFGEAA